MIFLQVQLFIDQEALVDLMIAELSAMGYDSFQEKEGELLAFVAKEQFSQQSLDALITQYEAIGKIEKGEVKELEPKNWNEEWEKNFQPVKIGKKIYVRADFHPEDPSFEHTIKIQPKMAFGTGHHETTYLILEEMLNHDWKGKKVLDYGCGTGILAIMAARLGAEPIEAIDYDPIAVENCIENCGLNGFEGISVEKGDKEHLREKNYDMILANINRNVLIDSMQEMAASMLISSTLFLSGIMEMDDDKVYQAARSAGLNLLRKRQQGEWVLQVYNKL